MKNVPQELEPDKLCFSATTNKIEMNGLTMREYKCTAKWLTFYCWILLLTHSHIYSDDLSLGLRLLTTECL